MSNIANGDKTALVTRVIDDGTFETSKGEICRLRAEDSEESEHAKGAFSIRALRKKIGGRVVALQVWGADELNRHIVSIRHVL